MEKNKLKAWEYEGMIKRHVEKCPNCDQLLQGIYQKSKISDADFSQSSTDALGRPIPLLLQNLPVHLL